MLYWSNLSSNFIIVRICFNISLCIRCYSPCRNCVPVVESSSTPIAAPWRKRKNFLEDAIPSFSSPRRKNVGNSWVSRKSSSSCWTKKKLIIHTEIMLRDSHRAFATAGLHCPCLQGPEFRTFLDNFDDSCSHTFDCFENSKRRVKDGGQHLNRNSVKCWQFQFCN